MPFLQTNEGLVNLAHVETARRVSSSRPGHDDLRLLDSTGECIGTISEKQLDECIEQIIAPAEPYDCLQIWFDEDGTHWVSVGDVLAWALSVYGWVYPITADDISPKTTSYALRKRGESKVELPMDATFDDEAQWVAEEIRRHERQKERDAAKTPAK